MQTLQDKTAIVTGGTRGIGYSIAQALLREGAKVFICGRKGADVKQSVAALAASGSPDSVDGREADVQRYEDCRRLVRAAADRFGGLDILVNNAGIGIFNPIDRLKPEDWDATIGTNLSGIF